MFARFLLLPVNERKKSQACEGKYEEKRKEKKRVGPREMPARQGQCETHHGSGNTDNLLCSVHTNKQNIVRFYNTNDNK